MDGSMPVRTMTIQEQLDDLKYQIREARARIARLEGARISPEKAFEIFKSAISHGFSRLETEPKK